MAGTANNDVRTVSTACSVPPSWTEAFLPGEQLRETHIAADLGISRSPLREALTKLEEEGLVVKVPFRGSFVVEVSAREVAEIAAIRLLVEPYAAELAAPTLRDAEQPAPQADHRGTLPGHGDQRHSGEH